MLPSLSRGLRLALVLALCVGYVAWHGHGHSAYAAKGGDDDDEGGDDDGGKGGSEDDDNADDDKDQPSVTAGGLFTMATYPVNEILRPLTMTQNITQLRLGLGTDVSDKGAFGSGGLSLEAQYGVSDNFTVIGGITDAYNFKQFGIYAGFEGSLAYDLLDIRLAANIHRNALPNFSNYCSPVATGDAVNPVDPSMCKAMGAALVNLPNGNYNAGGTKFSIDLGFPFRYAIKPEIAIVALQTLISIDLNSVDKDHVLSSQVMGTDAAGMPFTVTQNVRVGNGVKPDLNPSIGIATNPIPQLSVVVFGQFRVPDFDTSAGAFQVPVTGRVEFSPNQQFDVGLEFTLLNVLPPEGQSPFLNRFISLFVQSRFGK
ncbi:MAG TPA: hypothetical protein VF469_19140 [Kofleriaceae bacterium]